MERSRVAIVIPAFNEARTIRAIVSSVTDYGTAIVVDDGSTDATGEIAKDAGAIVVRHASNKGYDGALNSGFARAAASGAKYVITLDADGQHNPSQLADFVRNLDAGYDLVLGVRDKTQRLGEAIFAAVGKILWNIGDPLCGMKGYRMACYARAGAFDTFQSIGTELAVRTLVAGGKFIELPVVTRERIDTPRFGRVFSANVKILRSMLVLAYRYYLGRLSK